MAAVLEELSPAVTESAPALLILPLAGSAPVVFELSIKALTPALMILLLTMPATVIPLALAKATAFDVASFPSVASITSFDVAVIVTAPAEVMAESCT